MFHRQHLRIDVWSHAIRKHWWPLCRADRSVPTVVWREPQNSFCNNYHEGDYWMDRPEQVSEWVLEQGACDSDILEVYCTLAQQKWCRWLPYVVSLRWRSEIHRQRFGVNVPGGYLVMSICGPLDWRDWTSVHCNLWPLSAPCFQPWCCPVGINAQIPRDAPRLRSACWSWSLDFKSSCVCLSDQWGLCWKEVQVGTPRTSNTGDPACPWKVAHGREEELGRSEVSTGWIKKVWANMCKCVIVIKCHIYWIYEEIWRSLTEFQKTGILTKPGFPAQNLVLQEEPSISMVSDGLGI